MADSRVKSAEEISSGEVAKPPFAILADPATRFSAHARRFAKLAPGHQLEAYLRFLSALSQAQHDCQQDLPPAVLPEDVERAYQHGMPPLSVTGYEPDAAACLTLLRIAGMVDGADLPPPAQAAVSSIITGTDAERRAMMRAVVKAEIPSDQLAAHVLAAAAVQVHFSRLAAKLDAKRLTEVAPGACPACGAGPVASVVVELPKVSGHRYCCCSLCGTQWNVPRIHCLMCGSDKDVAYHNIEGVSDTIKAETCEACLVYFKIFHQDKDAALDPVADDVASLGLDFLLKKEGYQRGSANPFLLGY